MRQVCVWLGDEAVKGPLEKVQLIPNNNVLVIVFCLSGVLALAGQNSCESVTLSESDKVGEVESHHDQGRTLLALTNQGLVLWLSPRLTR